MRRLLLLPLLVLAACVTADGLADEEATEDESRSVRLDGRQLILDGFAGDVSLTAVPGLEVVEVAFTKRASGVGETQAEERIKQIRIEEAGDDELYQFVWRTDLEGSGAVDAEVRVPLGADVVVRLGAGDIDANGLRGSLDAETAAGEIYVDHLRTSALMLKTGSGDVTAGGAFFPPEARWRVDVGSGDLTLLLPPTASLRVEAESAAGSLDLDPELPFESVRQRGGPAGVDFRASLGDGEARLSAETGAGNVEILGYKAPAPESEAARETEPVRRDSAASAPSPEASGETVE